MSLSIKNLSWDSNFFNFPVTRFDCGKTNIHDLDEAVIECSKLGVKLVYICVKSKDDESILSAQLVNARLVDRKVTYLMSIDADIVPANHDKHISYSNQFSTQLESLAFQSGEFSRFRIDAKLPIQSFHRLYTQWLVNSLNGTIANSVLVYNDEFGKEVGFLTLGEKDARADIGLLAVDTKHRGKKIGQQLIQEAMYIAVREGYRELQVVTQRDNSTACAFYEKCGFQYEREEYIYHLWLD